MLQVAVLVLFQCMSNQRPSTLLHFFTHRLHICSFSVAAPQYWYGPATGSVGFFGDTCYQTHPLLCHPPCSFSMFHTRNSRTGTTSGLYSFGPIRMIFERQILFNQPRPQGFSLKKWVGSRPFPGPTHFLREKPWGRGCYLI